MNNITKKAYVKPDIALVDFSLSSSIAATCKYESTGTFVEDGCTKGYIENGMQVFTELDCDVAAPDYEVCYHVPSDGVNVFGS